MVKYTIVQPVEHDHKRLESGEIELPDEYAEPLLAVGAIQPPAKGKKGGKPDEAAEG